MPSLCHLWVIVNNGLTWSLHISSVVAKVNKTLGVLNRQFSSSIIGPSHRKPLYLTLVRSQLSYASEIRAPQSCIRDMRLLESVQRRATRFILNCSKDPNIRPNYKSRLIKLNLLPLSYWLGSRDLCFMFKYLNGGFDIEVKDFVKIASGRTRNSTDTLKLYPVHRQRAFVIVL